jgi:hypothetical protein
MADNRDSSSTQTTLPEPTADESAAAEAAVAAREAAERAEEEERYRQFLADTEAAKNVLVVEAGSSAKDKRRGPKGG